MKASVRIMSTLTTAWTILVFVVIVLMLLPIVPGVVEIKLPASEDWVTSIDNDTVSLSSNMSIRNGGLFPFNDLRFVIELYGNNRSVLARFSSNETDLQANKWVQVPLVFEINRTNIDNNRLRNMLFESVTFGDLVFFQVKYLLDFKTQLGANGSISLGPLIEKEFFTDHAFTTNANGSAAYSIPYSLNTSAILYGRNLTLTGNLSNSTNLLGTFNETIHLGTNVQGNLTIDLTPGAYERLSTSSEHLLFNVTVSIGELEWSYQKEWDWQPPGGG